MHKTTLFQHYNKRLEIIKTSTNRRVAEYTKVYYETKKKRNQRILYTYEGIVSRIFFLKGWKKYKILLSKKVRTDEYMFFTALR